MTAPSKENPVAPRTDPYHELRATLPLLLLTGALFAGSCAVYLTLPRLGPDNFPLWGLLLTLGFVAGIGSTVSWFFATDDGAPSTGGEGADSAASASAPERGPPVAFGRPVPDLARREGPSGPSGSAAPVGAVAPGKPAPWDEDVLPPVPSKGPRPVLTTLDDPGDIGRALEEIAEIQRQLVTRPPDRASAGKASARA